MNKTEILDSMELVEGWFKRSEGELLLDCCAEALKGTASKTIIEVGSYKGRSTVVLGSLAKQFDASVYAVDPHDGELSGSKERKPPTFEEFLENLKKHALESVVFPVKELSQNFEWTGPLSFVLIDGCHSYEAASRDFMKFSSFLEDFGLIAFHDYESIYPGVTRTVNDALKSKRFTLKGRSESLVVLKRKECS